MFSATWLYHPTYGASLFLEEAQHEAALEDGWYDTPAKFPVDAPPSPSVLNHVALPDLTGEDEPDTPKRKPGRPRKDA